MEDLEQLTEQDLQKIRKVLQSAELQETSSPVQSQQPAAQAQQLQLPPQTPAQPVQEEGPGLRERTVGMATRVGDVTGLTHETPRNQVTRRFGQGVLNRIRGGTESFEEEDGVSVADSPEPKKEEPKKEEPKKESPTQ